MFAPAHRASAATIPVTTCNASDLIAAISTANSNGAADTITLTAGCTYTFDTADNWWFGPNALLTIASDITIDGNGAILEVSAGVTRRRFFYIGADPAKFSSPMTTAGTSGALTLRNLTLRGGIAKGGNGGYGGGGAGLGGAIFNQGTVTLDHVTLTANSALGGSTSGSSVWAGGGVGEDASGDYSGGFGGGWSGSGYDGTGGASFYPGSGGPFGNGGGNVTNNSWAPAAVLAAAAFLARAAAARAWAAVFNLAGNLVIVNSTLTANMAQGGSGTDAGSGLGGAVFNLNGVVQITNSTLAGNTVQTGSPGGALYNLGYTPKCTNPLPNGYQCANIMGTASVILSNSILANTTGGVDLVNNQAADPGVTISVGVTVTTDAHNIVRSFSGTITGTPLSVDPMLAPLADNGGSTQTHALLLGSPAIDAGDDASCPATDQRGAARPGGAHCDIGAFEYVVYTLAYTAGANGTISGTSPQTVEHGADGTAVEAVPNTGYHFVQWSDDSTVNPRTDTNVMANVSVTAEFAIDTYTLTYTAGVNGTISGTTLQTVNHGASGTAVTTVPDTDYYFVQWNDGSIANPRTDTNVTANITAMALFEAVNDAPVITEGASTTVVMSEDSSPIPFYLTLNATDSDGDTLTWSISAPAAHGAAGASGTGASKAIIYAPNANFNGSDSFVVQVSDGNGGIDTITVNVTIEPVNDAPVNTTAPGITGTLLVGSTLTATPGDWNDTLDTAVSGSSTLSHAYQWQQAEDAAGTNLADIVGATSSTYTVTAADAHCSLRVTVTAADTGVGAPASQSTTASSGYMLIANTAPAITESSPVLVAMSEDGTPTPFSLTVHATDADGDPLTWSLSSPPTNGTVSIVSADAMTYTPTADYNGADSFGGQVSDGHGGTDAITVNVTIESVNDAPLFTKGANQTVNEDAGPQTVNTWAANISTGPADETDQTLTFTVTNNNTALFAVQPAISSSGTLAYTPAANVSGVATVTVILKDDGGTANGGVDTSAAQSFTITVVANQPEVNSYILWTQ